MASPRAERRRSPLGGVSRVGYSVQRMRRRGTKPEGAMLVIPIEKLAYMTLPIAARLAARRGGLRSPVAQW